ncbi:MAG: hypothetical protein K2X94_04290, partial [Amoebophilaceae bacterium]|nr:hypothetical protein [Amoebophilaceae bacterium]
IITKWWADLVQDKNVHLYIGEALYRVGVPSQVEPDWTMGNGVTEIKKQLLWNIADPTIKGSILFRHLSLRDKNVLPAKAAIQQDVWPHIALIPAMPWKGTTPPKPPIQLTKEATSAGVQLTWKAGEELSPPVYYAIYRFKDKAAIDIRSGENLLTTLRHNPTHSQQHWVDTSSTGDISVVYVVTALDRNHNESAGGC